MLVIVDNLLVCIDVIFFFNDTATTEIFTLSLHDALPILALLDLGHRAFLPLNDAAVQLVTCNAAGAVREVFVAGRDRKSTRLNSSHANISYAVFCLKKKKEPHRSTNTYQHANDTQSIKLD